MASRARVKWSARRGAAITGAILAAALVLASGVRVLDLVAREGRPPAARAVIRPQRAKAPAPVSPAARVASSEQPGERSPFPQGEEEGAAPYEEPGPAPSREPSPMGPDEPSRGRSWRPPSRDEVGTSLPWQPGLPTPGDWREPVRRRPAPIPPGRPLPYYPPEPPPTAPPGSAVLGPPDFVGSAAGYLEIPVGQTATLFARGNRDASLRQTRIATIVSREPDRVLVRGLFPGRTLLDVDLESGRSTYIVQVR